MSSQVVCVLENASGYRIGTSVMHPEEDKGSLVRAEPFLVNLTSSKHTQCKLETQVVVTNFTILHFTTQ